MLGHPGSAVTMRPSTSWRVQQRGRPVGSSSRDTICRHRCMKFCGIFIHSTKCRRWIMRSPQARTGSPAYSFTYSKNLSMPGRQASLKRNGSSRSNKREGLTMRRAGGLWRSRAWGS
jgi:hypothetical protein